MILLYRAVRFISIVLFLLSVGIRPYAPVEYGEVEPSFTTIEKREYTIILPVQVEEQEEVVVEYEPVADNEPVFRPKLLPYPEYITVRITGEQECNTNGSYMRIIEVPFKDYVKGVLANEWGHNWHEESIRAGAVAVKMYAWDAVLNGGKWGGYENGIVYDCDWDMVYNPSITREATNKAVDDTWDTFVTETDNTPMRVHFLAWWGACINWLGEDANCIGQWNSKTDAENGMEYKDILHKYLNEPVIVTYHQEEK